MQWKLLWYLCVESAAHDRSQQGKDGAPYKTVSYKQANKAKAMSECFSGLE